MKSMGDCDGQICLEMEDWLCWLRRQGDLGDGHFPKQQVKKNVGCVTELVDSGYFFVKYRRKYSFSEK